MRIQAMEIDSFRGFRERRRFDFQGVDVLVLYGPNGHGKSSFFDAIEWGLTGQINRYDESSDERKRARFVGNRFSDREPQVVLKLMREDGRAVTVIRTGTASQKALSDYGSSELQLMIEGEPGLQGEEAERLLKVFLVCETWRDKVDVNRGLSLTHLLGQERMSHFLRGMTGDERYDALSLLFGTEQFYRYRDLLREVQKGLESRRTEVHFQSVLLQGELREKKERVADLKTQHPDIEDTPGQLQEALFAYAGLFLPIDPEQPLEGIWGLLKERHEELVEEKIRFEYGPQRSLRLAYQHLPNWRGAQAFLMDGRARLLRLEQLWRISRKQQDVRWLSERWERLAEGGERRAHLMREAELVSGLIEQHMAQSHRLHEFVELVRAETVIAFEGKDCTQLIDRMNRVQSGGAVVGEVKTHLLSLENLHRAANERMQAMIEAHDLYNHWLDVYHEMTAMDEKYRDLLNVVHEYVANHADIERCPACGTDGITAEHLLAHVKTEQTRFNPRLPSVKEQLIRAKEKGQQQEAALEAAEQQIELVRSQVTALLNELDAKAGQLRTEAGGLQERKHLMVREIDLLDQLVGESAERIKRLGFAPESTDLHAELKRLEQQLEAEWHRESEGFEEAELLDLGQMIEEARRTLTHLETGHSEFLTHMQGLGLLPEAGAGWSDTDVESLLAQEQERQSAWLARHEQKEQAIAKVMGVHARYERYQELEGLRQQVEALQGKISGLQAEHGQIQNDIEVLKETYKKIPEAVDRLNEKAIAGLFGTIQSIFERINSHPLYRTLHFVKEQRYGANRLLLTVKPHREDAGESDANPSFIFSAAQINSIALSFFLAMALQQQWSTLQLIAMDDPVQSMDDLNVLALIDLLRSMCEREELGRQVIISTHDRTFYQMMQKKFRFLNVGIIEYEGYGEAGPVIKKQSDPLGQEQYVQRNVPLPVKELSNEFLS